MKESYVTFIQKSNEKSHPYIVYVPEFDIYTEGDSLTNAMEMARDAIGLKGITYEDQKIKFPKHLSMDEAKKLIAKEFKVNKNDVITLVDVDFAEYRRSVDIKAVRRNVSIPSYLDYAAEKYNLNVSNILKNALLGALEKLKEFDKPLPAHIDISMMRERLTKKPKKVK